MKHVIEVVDIDTIIDDEPVPNPPMKSWWQLLKEYLGL